MHIVRNFAELENCSDLSMLNKRIFKFIRLTEEEFDKYIKLHHLSEHEYEELDAFIEEIFKIYPQLVPTIVDSKRNKNRYIKNENFNARNDEHFIRLLEEQRLLDAAQLYCSNEHTRVNQDLETKKFYDDELYTQYCIMQKHLAQLPTKEKVFKDIEALLYRKFGEVIPFPETITMLAEFMTEEIILRTQIPDDYVYLHDYEKIMETISKFRYDRVTKVHKIIFDLYITQYKTPEETLEFLKANI